MDEATNKLKSVGGKAAWVTGAEFAGNIVAATVVFMLIGGAAIGIGAMERLASRVGASGLLVNGLRWLELLVFGINVATFAIYVLVTTIGFVSGLIASVRRVWDGSDRG